MTIGISLDSVHEDLEQTKRKLEGALARLAQLEAQNVGQPMIGLGDLMKNGRSLPNELGLCKLAYYEGHPKKAFVEQWRATEAEKLHALGSKMVAGLGPWFCDPATLEIFAGQLTENQIALIKRSTHGAGVFGPGGNLGRWCYADLTSDEKVEFATSINPFEDHEKVIDDLIERIERSVAEASNLPFVAGEPTGG